MCEELLFGLLGALEHLLWHYIGRGQRSQEVEVVSIAILPEGGLYNEKEIAGLDAPMLV